MSEYDYMLEDDNKGYEVVLPHAMRLSPDQVSEARIRALEQRVDRLVKRIDALEEKLRAQNTGEVSPCER